MHTYPIILMVSGAHVHYIIDNIHCYTVNWNRRKRCDSETDPGSIVVSIVINRLHICAKLNA